MLSTGHNMSEKEIRSTKDIEVPEKLIDQVIGQTGAIAIIKKAAKQRRNVFLVGEPGTGKTMLAQAMSELLSVMDLEDILVYRNMNDENVPIIKTVKTYTNQEDRKKHLDGQGRQIVQKERISARAALGKTTSLVTPIVFILVIALLALSLSGLIKGYDIIVLAALILGIMIFGSVFLFMGGLTRRVGMPGMNDANEPKLIVDNTGMDHAPFIDATGSKAGALFGDVRHDPLQTGGLGTPAHLRVESGGIHKANKGVLFIDEISSLDPKSQQELLTAMQEKRYSITGQSEMSSGALVRTEPVPCDFILVAAGNLQDIQHMHPALRSRIRGYGYEVFMESTMSDTPQNRKQLMQFVAQEVKKDGKIPPFDASALDAIIEEARKRAGRKGRLSLILRDLGGLIRAAGDIAVERGQSEVTAKDVESAKALAMPIEAQVVSQQINYRKDYQVFTNKGYAIGKVNGLAVVGSSIMKHMGKDVANYDMHVQFLQTYEGIEGDSASISVAVSIISAMESLPVDQSIAMTGSLSVRGAVLPVGGVTSKVEAAISTGMRAVIIPYSNKDDIYISKDRIKKIKIIPVKNFAEVLEHAIRKSKRRDEIISELRKYEKQ
jgi:Lon-like ATP-dependent protease